jgi:hypothetical protein
MYNYLIRPIELGKENKRTVWHREYTFHNKEKGSVCREIGRNCSILYIFVQA